MTFFAAGRCYVTPTLQGVKFPNGQFVPFPKGNY